VIRRREFIAGLGSAAAWPAVSRARCGGMAGGASAAAGCAKGLLSGYPEPSTKSAV
jgi:hypothetical protein